MKKRDVKKLGVACEGASTVALGKLKPFLDAPKILPDEEYRRLRALMESQGFSEPLVVWRKKMRVLHGRQRLEALRRMSREGWAIPAVPVVWVEASDEVEARRKALALTSQFGVFVDKRLVQFLGKAEVELQAAFEMFNFPEVDLHKILREMDAEAEAPEPEPLPEKPITRKGDVWLLGSHRLLCGDSTSKDSFRKLMGGQRVDFVFADPPPADVDQADMVFTDPPYNVSYEEKNRYLANIAGRSGRAAGASKIENDKMSSKNFRAFLGEAFSRMFEYSRPGACAYVCHADSEGSAFRDTFTGAGWMLKQCLIWVKDSFVLGRQDYQWRHEPLLYGWKPGGPHKWYGGRTQDTIWEIDRPRVSEDHPTMKPIELILKAIRNNTLQGDIVLDAFGGSGSTLIAAEKTARSARIIELDPRYCDVTVRRWEEMTGRKADRRTGKQ